MKIFKKLKDKYFYISFWKKESLKEQYFFKNHREIDYLNKWYKKKTHQNLNISEPLTYNEKIQWLKLFGNLQDYSTYADKFLVRQYVKFTIGEQYLIPIINVNNKGYFENVDQIDFDMLPNEFVIQCNHGAHMTHIIADKSKTNIQRLKNVLKKEMEINFAYCVGYETQYKNINKKIFITEYLKQDDSLIDYKFFYFNGKMDYFSVDVGRFTNHRRSIYYKDGSLASFQCKNMQLVSNIDMEAVNKLLPLADKLAKGFKHVRVDMYFYNNHIYFGELTFTSGSGIAQLRNNSENFLMGKRLDLNNYSLNFGDKSFKFNLVDYLMVVSFLLRCEKEIEWNNLHHHRKWILSSHNNDIIYASYDNGLNIHIFNEIIKCTDADFKSNQKYLYGILYGINNVTNLKYENIDSVFLENTLGMDLPYIKEAHYEECYLNNLKVFSINGKIIPINESEHYKFLNKGVLNIKTRTNLTNQTHAERFALLKDISVENYGNNNTFITVYNDDFIIRDGAHRAAVLYKKFGNIKIKILRLRFSKNFYNFNQYYANKDYKRKNDSLLTKTNNTRFIKKTNVLRSDTPTIYLPRDIATLKKIGVENIIDFKTYGHRAKSQILIDNFNYINIGLPAYSSYKNKFKDEIHNNANYYMYLLSNTASMKNIFDCFLKLDGKFMIFCYQGMDRTGVVSFLLENLLEVNQEQSIDSYVLSQYYLSDIKPNYIDIDVFESFLAKFKKIYVNAYNYLLSLGFNKDEINTIKEKIGNIE